MKRFFDVLASFLGTCILLPIFLCVALFIKYEDRGPIFYRGLRVGRYGEFFRIFKFRTMVINAEKKGGSSSKNDDPRITRVGRFLRKYKLDELPQLLNVLKGEMSLVGPRPQVKWAVDLYNEVEKSILDVKPGMTDYASLRFSNEGEILKGSTNPDKDYMEKIHPEKMRLSLEYVNNRSFWLDLRLIFLTIAKILKA
jgi:lipopolysaccharide/colanic/teichoic acid biosynthesis glycosyltransferase